MAARDNGKTISYETARATYAANGAIPHDIMMSRYTQNGAKVTQNHKLPDPSDHKTTMTAQAIAKDVMDSGIGAPGQGATMAHRGSGVPVPLQSFEVYWDFTTKRYKMFEPIVIAPGGNNEIKPPTLEFSKTYYCHARYYPPASDSEKGVTLAYVDTTEGITKGSGSFAFTSDIADRTDFIEIYVKIADIPPEKYSKPADLEMKQYHMGPIFIFGGGGGGGSATSDVRIVDITSGTTAQGYTGTDFDGGEVENLFIADIAYGYDLKSGTRIVAHPISVDSFGGSES